MLVNPLGTHVVRCTNKGVSSCGLRAEEPAQAEIPELDHSLRSDEYIGRLDV